MDARDTTPAPVVRPIPLAASDLVAGLAATVALLVACAALFVALVHRGAIADDARSWTLGLPLLAAIPAAVALLRVGRGAEGVGHVRRLAEPALLGAALLALAAARALPAVPHALLPGEARLAAASLAAMAAWLLVGAAATRVLPGRHRLVLAAVAGTLLVATVASAWHPLLHGFPSSRAEGYLGYTNASAGAAAVVLLGGLRGLASLRARQDLVLRVVSGVSLGLGVIVLASTASRAMTVATIFGSIWLVVLGKPRGTRAAGLSIAVGIVLLVGVAALVAAWSTATAWPIVVLLVAIGVATVLPAGARRVEAGVQARWPVEREPRHRLAIGLVVVLALVVVLGVPGRNAWHSFTHDDHIATNAGALRLTSASGNHRWTWWKEAAHAVGDHPWVGQGGSAFEVVHLQRRDDASIATHVHALPLELVLEGGIVFGGLALLGLACIVVALWRAAVPRAGGASAAIGAVAMTLLFGSLADWTLDVPLIGIAFGLAAGAAVATGSTALPEHARISRASRLRGSLVIVVVAVATSIACAVPFGAALFDWRADSARGNGHQAAAQRWGWRAWRLAPSTERLLRVVGDARGSGDDTLAQQRIGQATSGALRNDVVTWTAVYDVAPVWHAFALQQLALRQQHRLDPLDYPAPKDTGS